MKTLGIFLVAIGVIAAFAGAVAYFGLDKPTTHVNHAGESHKLTVYKSATCGCCGIWTSLMQDKGYKVDVVNTEELNVTKEKYKVPESLYSCHTTIVNDGQYFVEGHIPEEAISKLLEDEPAIAGIGMPGMPSASPGMPGKKLAPFDISQVTKDGAISQYMSI
jgi:hypothetical protein